jgi:hypothetical protein
MLRGGLLRYLRDDSYILGDSGNLGDPHQIIAPFRQSQMVTTEQHQYNYCQITTINMLYLPVRF